MGHYQELDHTADLALRIQGDDLTDLFVTAALGMFALVAEPVAGAESELSVPVVLSALDVETLLVDWLNELLYLHETYGVVFRRFDITAMSSTHVNAVAYGVPVGVSLAYIKAATFHNLEVIALPDLGYETQVVFDI